MRFRLITYNIHKGIGGIDRRYRPERIVETLLHYSPDIVMLQEVDEGVPRSRHDRQIDLLGDALGLRHRAYQPNVRLRHGHYGNALLSSFPLRDVHDIELTIPLKKRRRAQVAHCQVRQSGHTRTILLYNFHLGLAGFERRIQVRRFLASHILMHAQHDMGIIAAGDFNDGRGILARRLFQPSGFKLASGETRTFPALRPIRCLDQIYYRGGIDVNRCFPGRVRVARMASDHLPVVADFVLPPLAQPSSETSSTT